MYTVGQFMTRDPQRISVEVPLADAHKVLQRGHARHLPVVDGAQLVGIVSLVGIYFAERTGNGRRLTVKDAMEQPVTVAPGASLEKVAEQMAGSKVGAVVVLDAGKVAGIFTTIDALRALAWLATPAETRSVYEAIRTATVEATGGTRPHRGTGSSRAPPVDR